MAADGNVVRQRSTGARTDRRQRRSPPLSGANRLGADADLSLRAQSTAIGTTPPEVIVQGA